MPGLKHIIVEREGLLQQAKLFDLSTPASKFHGVMVDPATACGYACVEASFKDSNGFRYIMLSSDGFQLGRAGGSCLNTIVRGINLDERMTTDTIWRM